MLIFDEAEELELACLQALQKGDHLQAFRYADRRCRILPRAKSYHQVLRAEALHTLGYHGAAVVALQRAVELDPGDQRANRRMMLWASGNLQTEAAERLLSAGLDQSCYADALRCLAGTGRDKVVKLDILSDRICGWIAWNTDDAIEIVVDHLPKERLAGQSGHPLGEDTSFRIAVLDLSRPSPSRALTLRLFCDGRLFFEKRYPAAQSSKHSVVEQTFNPLTGNSGPALTVIVPVYGDIAATRSCLLSLRDELARSQECRAILIDDASPDREIRFLLEELATDGSVLVLRNTQNLGFAASVNRGLSCVRSGDILLLNADTVLPRDCLNRFIEAAKSSTDIGTITPLSNNGEFTSFPIPNRFNSLPNRDELARIDAAAQSGGNSIIDLPNGIGFCLYITRQCLDVIGSLSIRYGRGYYEDVDYCLRAREYGFRNVCAPSIYVGHLGSRSFGAAKRGLVVKNLALIEQRFPNYQNECAAFLVADPLKEARSQIERVLLRSKNYDRLVIAPDVSRNVARARARWLVENGHTVLLMQIVGTGSASLIDPSGIAPQNLEIPFGEISGDESLAGALKSVSWSRLEIFAPLELPDHVIKFVVSRPSPVDMIPDESVPLQFGSELPGNELAQNNFLAHLDAKIESYIAICDESRRYVRLLTARCRSARYEPLYKTKRGRRKFGRVPASCGILLDRASSDSYRLILKLARASGRSDVGDFVYLGSSLNDSELIATGRVLPTGVLGDNDFPEVIEHYGIDRIFLPDRRPLFGSHGLHIAKTTGLRLARFHWPFSSPLRSDDLALHHQTNDEDAIHAVLGWLDTAEYNV